MQKSLLQILILISFSISSFAQNQNNQWRFGVNGAIDFNTPTPTSLTGCVISTPEGSASIADNTTGALLFYTDGVTIWNANNIPMPNGTGLLGSSSGQLSSTTAAVIVPKPFDPDKYYVIAIDEQFSGAGITYSIVDMTLNGGLGDVIVGQKNRFLFATSSEKLHVVPTADRCGYWLITHDNPGETFYVFKITSTGINTTPVTSTLGGTQGNGAGQLKVNQQFNKLAMGDLFGANVELFDFNNNTGAITNPVIWNFNFGSPLIYGVEFSANGNYLYISNIDKVVQYDITSNIAATIEATGIIISTTAPIGYQPAGLQIGPNNKIYIASGTIDAINSPDNAGVACGYQYNSIPLIAGGSTYGLPQKVYIEEVVDTNKILASDTCLTQNIAFSILDTNNIISVSWNFDDSTSGNNTSSLLFPTHQFSAIGTYVVEVIIQYNCFADTLIDTIEIVNCVTGIFNIKILGDTCLLGSPIIFQAEGTSNSPYFFWNFDDPASGVNDTITITGASPSPNPSHIFIAPGLYTVCVRYTEPGFPDSIFCRTISIGECCNGSIVSVDTCLQNAISFSVSTASTINSINWNFGDPTSSSNTSTLTNPSHTFTAAGTYIITGTAIASCGTLIVTDTIEIVDCAPPVICNGFILSSDSCLSNTINFSIQTDSTIQSVAWNFGDPTSANNTSNQINSGHIFSAVGSYIITANVVTNCGSFTVIDTFDIVICPSPTICNGIILSSDSCLSNTINFSIQTDSTIQSVAWNFGDPSSASNTSNFINANHIFTVVGSYTITANVVTNCGSFTVIDTIEIVDCTIPICAGQINVLDSCLSRAINFNVITSNSIQNITWNFGDPSTGTLNFSNVANTSHIFSDSGKFTITAIVEFDCGFDTLTRVLQIGECDTIQNECTIYIPNAFSPNKDSFNELFYPTASCDFEKFEMKIFSRWGQEIFSSSALDAKWNAVYNDQDCAEGVYLYIINYKFFNSVEVSEKGIVTILR